MKELPLICKQHEVQAILAGRKTQTRRVIKPQPDFQGSIKATRDGRFILENWPEQDRQMLNYGRCKEITSPYGKPGDLLWVRERFSFHDDGVDQYGEDAPPGYLYYASYPENPNEGQHYNEHDFATRDELEWKPSTHMPKSAARIWLQVESVKVERGDNGWEWCVSFNILSTTGKPNN